MKKEKLSDVIVKKISPISKEIKKLNQEPLYIDQILQDGSEKAYELSSKKIKDIKKKFGFWSLFTLKNLSYTYI